MPVSQSNASNGRAIVATRSGGITEGLRTALSASGYEIAETFVTDSPEDGRYHLPPETVDRIADLSSSSSSDGVSLVVVDGEVHPGQMIDLADRLDRVDVRDRRDLFLGILGDAGNPAASIRREIRRRRIDRRAVAREQRGDATQGPTGDSGTLEELDRRIQRLRAELDDERGSARDRVTDAYTDADARVALVGGVGSPTTALWSELTGSDAPEEAPCGPPRPETATATVGPHTVAVTDLPGVPGDSVPGWLTDSLPGFAAVLDEADLVAGVEADAPLVDSAARMFDPEGIVVGGPDAVREAVSGLLESVGYTFRLPYDDAAHSLLSDLYDGAVVEEVNYGDGIEVTVTVSRRSEEEVLRRVEAVGGEAVPEDEG